MGGVHGSARIHTIGLLTVNNMAQSIDPKETGGLQRSACLMKPWSESTQSRDAIKLLFHHIHWEFACRVEPVFEELVPIDTIS